MRLKNHIPNTITSMNLLSGVLGVIFALEGRPDTAFLLMIAAAVFDFCDGLAARALHAYSDIGKELDSLADMVSFGVLPSVMLYQAGAGQGLLRYIPLFIALMSALRLARFNLDERQQTDFIGLPTPACAMLCGATVYFLQADPDSAVSVFLLRPGVLATLSVVLGILLVSGIPMFSMKIKKGHSLVDAPRPYFFILVFASLVATWMLHYDWSFAVVLIFLAYIVVNLVYLPLHAKTNE